MTVVRQDPVTRKWGIRVTEDIGEVKFQAETRPLLEHYEFNSPGEVMQFNKEFVTSMRMGRYRIAKEPGAFGQAMWRYDVGAPNSNEIIFSESGFLKQEQIQEHLSLVTRNLVDFPNVENNVKKAIEMKFGGYVNPEVDISKIDRSHIGSKEDYDPEDLTDE